MDARRLFVPAKLANLYTALFFREMHWSNGE
jgi:hypothetical protein